MKLADQQVDVLIIGAGPSGTVAASILKKQGLKVKIVEKQKFPRFVIGESMLPRCMDNLDKADFIQVIEAAGFEKKIGAKFEDFDRECEFDFSLQYTKGWTWTWQVQRADFDKLLADEVEKRGVEIDYEHAVTAVEFDAAGNSRTTCEDKAGNTNTISAKFLIDASGFGRVLPKLLNLESDSTLPERTSLFTHVVPKQAQTGKEKNQIIIIVYTASVWGWIIPFSDGTSSIGVVGDISDIERFQGTQDERMRQWIAEVPALKERFTDSEFRFEPRSIKDYSASVKTLYGKGFALTGNSAEFLDPIFSSGTTFATESAARSSELIIRQFSGEEVDWEKEYSDYIYRGVDVFRSFINHWYDGTLQKIIFSDLENQDLKRQICSILAGYVWDMDNPLVVSHKRALPAIAHIVSAV